MILESLIPLVLGVIFTVLFTPLIEDYRNNILIKFFGNRWFSKKNKLSGFWLENWKTDSGNYPSENKDYRVEIKQWGSRIYSQFMSEGRDYYLKGKIKEGKVTGEWSDCLDGSTYFGVFQLIIDPKGNQMTGKWLGYSKHGYVNHGDWIWTRTQ